MTTGNGQMNHSNQVTDLVKQAARDAGFELVGIAPVYDFDELDRFREWIAAGRAAEMKYMEARDEAGALKRSSLRSTAALGSQRDRLRHQLQHRPTLLNPG